MQQSVYETKIYDICDGMTCKNARCKLGLTVNRTLSRLRLTSSATVSDHVCVMVEDTLNTIAAKLLFICVM